MKSKTAMSFLGILLLAGAAYAQETRTELKRADLTGTNMEIWTAVYEFPVGYTIPVHSHKGEEVVYVLEGAKLKRPDGTEVELKTGTYNVVPRDLVHGGATVLGPGSLKLFAAHVIDKGGPIRILPKAD
jgi:quercetin dioxygenase-like cupin family protein